MRNVEHCSFCGNSSERARALVAGPERVFICDQCVGLCRMTIREVNSRSPDRREGVLGIEQIRDTLLRALCELTRVTESVPAWSECARDGPRDSVGYAVHEVINSLRYLLREVASHSPSSSPGARGGAWAGSPARIGPSQGAITDVFASRRDQVASLTAAPTLAGCRTVELRGLGVTGLTSFANLAGLDAIAPGDFPVQATQTSGSRVHAIPAILERKLAGLEVDEVAALASRWVQSQEPTIAAWTIEDARQAVRRLASLARFADARTGLFVWIEENSGPGPSGPPGSG
jgi:hypothetical protein